MIEGKEVAVRIIKEFVELLPEEGRREVLHFLDNDEYEMAFEGLNLEFIGEGFIPPNFNFCMWEKVAKSIGLEEHSTIDNKFWSKFEQWGQPPE